MQKAPSHLVEDIEQKVLIKLWKNLPEFKLNHEKGKFSTWMSRVIKNTMIDELRSNKTRAQSQQKYKEEVVDNEEAPSDLEQIIEEEWKVYLTQKAFEKIEARFKGKAIEVFNLCMDDVSPEDIAKQLDLKRIRSTDSKKRVQTALREEIQALQHLLEGTSHHG